MDANLSLVLDQVSKDKGIDREILIRALEEAILAAAKRSFGTERNLMANFNLDKGAVDLTQAIRVVRDITDNHNEITLEECKRRSIDVDEGDEMVFPIYFLAEDQQAAREQDEMYGDILNLKTYRRGFGRIAAQTAKQVIIQRIRDAERNIVFTEFKDRKGELVTGIVRRFERGNMIVEMGRAEAILPLREQCQRETYRAGDRVQAYVIDVQEHSRGPQIVLSRTCPELVVKLFELEVPEIYEGIVRIESAAREPGARAKIAVSSQDRDVDPVGACVGMKGSRVQGVVQELRGEKIDIVPYSEDQATFVCNALQPAEVSRVLIDEANHAMEIIVPDDQLSLAIGRKGQNVRLASQLTGWRLDIHSETRIADIKARAWKSLGRVEGCNEFLIQTLYNHGIRSADQLLGQSADFLLQFPGVEEETLDRLMDSARQVAILERHEASLAEQEANREKQAEDVAKRLQQLVRMTAKERLRAVRGLGESTLRTLSEAGLDTVEALVAAHSEQLETLLGISERKAGQFKYAAHQFIKTEEELRQMATEMGLVIDGDVVRLPGEVAAADADDAASSGGEAGEEATSGTPEIGS